MKLYIVVEKQSEYNDEIYAFHEGNGGIPIKAFNNKEDAELLCRMKNIAWIHEVTDSYAHRYPLHVYGDFIDYFDRKAQDILEEYGFISDTNELQSLNFSKMSTEHVDTVLHYSLAPFHVIECDYENKKKS